jgi:hypothetical protein
METKKPVIHSSDETKISLSLKRVSIFFIIIFAFFWILAYLFHNPLMETFLTYTLVFFIIVYLLTKLMGKKT